MFTFMTCYIWLATCCGLFSIRVSNELGASRPKETKFAVAVAVSTSIFIGAIFMTIVLIWRTSLPKFFSDSHDVIHGASRLGYLLAVTIFMSSIWPVLSGSVSKQSAKKIYVSLCYKLGMDPCKWMQTSIYDMNFYSDFAGVAVGAGWQVPVAFINVGCYYLVGIPLGILFGFKLKRGPMVKIQS